MKFEWVRRQGRGEGSGIYYTADTPMGRIRVSRINKHHIPGFRVYFPDGMQFTASTFDEGKAYAENYYARQQAAFDQASEAVLHGSVFREIRDDPR